MPRTQLSQAEEQQTRKSLFLGITIWFLHLNIVNALISVACKWGGLTVPIGGLSGLQFVEAAISLVSIGLLIYLIFLAWRNWQTFQTERPTNTPQLIQDTEEKRQSLMAFIAMTLNGFFALYILTTFIATFSLKACGQA